MTTHEQARELATELKRIIHCTGESVPTDKVDLLAKFVLSLPARLTATRDARDERIRELTETYIDGDGLSWSPPTAYAYAQVCKARDQHQAAKEQAEAALATALDRVRQLEARQEPRLTEEESRCVEAARDTYYASARQRQNKSLTTRMIDIIDRLTSTAQPAGSGLGWELSQEARTDIKAMQDANVAASVTASSIVVGSAQLAGVTEEDPYADAAHPINAGSTVRPRGQAEGAAHAARPPDGSPLRTQDHLHPPAPQEAGCRAAQDVIEERKRQVEIEGWSPEHDDQHCFGEMARAAGWYAINAAFVGKPECIGDVNDPRHEAHRLFAGDTASRWPWDLAWWKPKNARRDLVRAGALILAEIERLDRASPPPSTQEGG